MDDVRAREVRDTALALAETTAAAMGLVVVDVTFGREAGRQVLRVVLDRPTGGVTLEDLERFSRAYGDTLDAADPIEGAYHLETQSPGLQRTLRSDREFEVFRGRRLAVRTYPPERREIVGTLLGLENGLLRLRGDDGEEISIPREQVARANLQDGN